MKRAIVISIIAAAGMLNTSANATVHFNDGGYHIINYTIDDWVYVDYQVPQASTQVGLIYGGRITGNLNAYGSSQVFLSGGTIGRELYALDNSQMIIYEGSIGYAVRAYGNSNVTVCGGLIGDDLWAQENSRVNLLGGTISDNLWADNNSHVSISGGKIGSWLFASDSTQVDVFGGSIDNWLCATHNSQVTILGGSIGWDLWVRDDSHVSISSGSIGNDIQTWGNGEVTISGGRILGDIYAGYYFTNNSYSGVVKFEGANFTINGTSVGYGQYFATDYATGILRGTLANGDRLNNKFYIYDDASIILIPEPSAIVLFGLGAVAARKIRNPQNRAKY
jgi:hypothetical protein